MASGMIARYAIIETENNQDDLAVETVSHLYEILHKSRTTEKYYSPEKGRSFSYFSATCHNYLINANRKGQKRTQSQLPLESYTPKHETLKHVEVLPMYLSFLEEHRERLFREPANRIMLDGMVEIMRYEGDNIETNNDTKPALKSRGYDLSHYVQVRRKLGHLFRQIKRYLIEHPEANELPYHTITRPVIEALSGSGKKGSDSS